MRKSTLTAARSTFRRGGEETNEFGRVVFQANRVPLAIHACLNLISAVSDGLLLGSEPRSLPQRRITDRWPRT